VVGGAVILRSGERPALLDYLQRLTELDGRAVVRLQAAGDALGVWSGPPFDVVALRPVGLAEPTTCDVTVPAVRLRERAEAGDALQLPANVTGPSWVGLLPPRVGWEERGRAEVAYLRDAVGSAKHFFAQRADGVVDDRLLRAIADDVWERACLAEVPVRAAHAASRLGLLGPGSGEAVAYEAAGWLRLQVPGGSVAVHRAPSLLR
jgi:hypothetical protein